jgi:hypothetical protein
VFCVVEHENNKKSLTFNGVNQYFDIDYIGGQCIDDPEKCNLGIAISFTIKFNELKDNTYIYTNCGNQPDSSGYAIYYKNERMYFKVSTSLGFPHFSLDSWSSQQLFCNQYINSIQTGHSMTLIYDNIDWFLNHQQRQSILLFVCSL